LFVGRDLSRPALVDRILSARPIWFWGEHKQSECQGRGVKLTARRQFDLSRPALVNQILSARPIWFWGKHSQNASARTNTYRLPPIWFWNMCEIMRMSKLYSIRYLASRFALDGKLCLYFEPPGYRSEDWATSPDTQLAQQVTAAATKGRDTHDLIAHCYVSGRKKSLFKETTS
jgi:hypothetical protein